MIIIRLSGGLGNQLFQYALGRALSLKTNQELKLDLHHYDLQIEKDRSYKLDVFSVKAAIATNEDFKKLRIPNPKNHDVISKSLRKLYRILESKKPLSKRTIVLERTHGFDPEILKIDHSCYISGVWQSEKYFLDYKDQIFKDFQLSVPLSPDAAKLEQAISSSNAISLHVRRGDQVHNPELLKKHGALTDDYYHRAVDYIISKTSSPHVFIFSDEIEWCKENLTFNVPTTYVQGKNLKDYEELILMSHCKHNITAKSSYSWWAAWLNQNSDKIVIAPQKRYGENSKINENDLIPDSWIRL